MRTFWKVNRLFWAIVAPVGFPTFGYYFYQGITVEVYMSDVILVIVPGLVLGVGVAVGNWMLVTEFMLKEVGGDERRSSQAEDDSAARCEVVE